MKTKFLLGLLGALVLVSAGCVGTVSGGRTAGVPFVNDTLENRYRRPVDQVFNAARQVILDNRGTLNNEGITYNATNQMKTITGKVNQRSVWIRVQPVDSEITSVAVQTRTAGGSPDLNLAHELATEIALKLTK